MAFDEAAAAGTISVRPDKDDLTNLRLVASGRLDAAVIDVNVMNFLTQNDARLLRNADTLRFNEKPLENKDLFVCFRADDAGRAARDLFNAHIASD